MSTLRVALFLFLSLTGTLLAPIKAVQADVSVNPEPNPTLGLAFALSPGTNNGSFTGPAHNGTTVKARQNTGPAAWVTHWYPGPVCNPDGTCTITSDGDIPHIQINGDGYTNGRLVFGGIYEWPSNTLKWGMNFNVKSWPGYRDGSFGVRAPFTDCGVYDAKHGADSYAAAYDWTTASWSPVVWLYTNCYTL
jgi:hypothetical protein